MRIDLPQSLPYIITSSILWEKKHRSYILIHYKHFIHYHLLNNMVEKHHSCILICYKHFIHYLLSHIILSSIIQKMASLMYIDLPQSLKTAYQLSHIITSSIIQKKNIDHIYNYLRSSQFLLCSNRQPLTSQALPTKHNRMLHQPAVIKVFLGADSSSLKVAELVTVV